MYSLEITIQGLPKLQNSALRTHWRAYYQHAKQWKSFVAMALRGRIPETPLKRAKLTLTRHSCREPDFDGLVSSFKACIDALVETNVLENDKPSNIGGSVYLWVKGPQKFGFVTIKIEEISDLGPNKKD